MPNDTTLESLPTKVLRLEGEIKRLRRLLAKCAEHAEDGLNGSANYALDRLTQIQKVAKHG